MGLMFFVFDWYWYDGAPFLEDALNDGFLKAKNNDKMKFYLMWANHDVPGNMWNPYLYKSDSLLYQSNVSKADFEKIVERVITNYFSQPFSALASTTILSRITMSCGRMVICLLIKTKILNFLISRNVKYAVHSPIMAFCDISG